MRMPVIAAAVVSALLMGVLSAQADQRNFRAHLAGRNEVPPVETRAQGQAKFQVTRDGARIHFKLNVANIRDITQAHIHLAPRGENGAVVVWLFPSMPPATLIPGRFQGVLSAGVITEANLVGPLVGQPISALIDEMAAGNTYVNVHTSGVPSGEVRGQIR